MRSTIVGFPASGGRKHTIRKETRHDTRNTRTPI
jgi:hypothetical protein